MGLAKRVLLCFMITTGSSKKGCLMKGVFCHFSAKPKINLLFILKCFDSSYFSELVLILISSKDME